MQKIRSIEEDIKAAQSCVVGARANTKTVTEQLLSSFIRMQFLNRKKSRITEIYSTLSYTLKGSLAQYKDVLEKRKRGALSKAYESLLTLRKSLAALSSPKESPSLIIVSQLKDKLKIIENEIKAEVKAKLSEMTFLFSKTE